MEDLLARGMGRGLRRPNFKSSGPLARRPARRAAPRRVFPRRVHAAARPEPARALAPVFRGEYLQALHRAFTTGKRRFAGSLASLAEPEAFATWLRELRQHDWIVYAKRPFAGPTQLLEYLGRYTHRVAISNERLVGHTEGVVRFRWRDYADGDRMKIMTLTAEEFIRRFLLHVVPGGFVRIRHFGFLANRTRRAKLARCRALLAQPPAPLAPPTESVSALMLRLTGIDIER